MMARQHDNDMRGENHWWIGELCRELGIHITFGANGQIVGLKHSVKRGVSTTLYKWTGPQPQLDLRGKAVH